MPVQEREDGRLACALDLGWRIAELYALIDDPEAPASHGLLPAHDQLPRADQLELQVRAAAGDARQSGADESAEALEKLVESARAAAEATDGGLAFRRRLLACHVALAKQLWARHEAAGRPTSSESASPTPTAASAAPTGAAAVRRRRGRNGGTPSPTAGSRRSRSCSTTSSRG